MRGERTDRYRGFGQCRYHDGNRMVLLQKRTRNRVYRRHKEFSKASWPDQQVDYVDLAYADRRAAETNEPARPSICLEEIGTVRQMICR